MQQAQIVRYKDKKASPISEKPFKSLICNQKMATFQTFQK